jgi:hypothetical protein
MVDVPNTNRLTMMALVFFLILVLGFFVVSSIIETDQFMVCKNQEHKACPVFTCAEVDTDAQKTGKTCANAAFRTDDDGNKMCSGTPLEISYLTEVIVVSVIILVVGGLLAWAAKPETYTGTFIILGIVVVINIAAIYWMGITKKGLECFNRKNIKCFNDWSCDDGKGATSIHGALNKKSNMSTLVGINQQSQNIKPIFDPSPDNTDRIVSIGSNFGYCDPRNSSFDPKKCTCSVADIPDSTTKTAAGSQVPTDYTKANCFNQQQK